MGEEGQEGHSGAPGGRQEGPLPGGEGDLSAKGDVSVEKDYEDKDVICSNCSTVGAVAEWYCKLCSETLCEPCLQAHHRVRLTRGHNDKVVKLGEVLSEEW